MTTHQIIILSACALLLALLAIVVRGEFVRLQDKLTMARKTIEVLAPKAYAYDTYIKDRRSQYERAMGRQPAEVQNTSVNYQHLSAECDGCDEPAARDMGPW